ncbi:hypothetical protein [uncultured Aquimarina sp.]|uniref:hypothetical protein n=1 Tax=uncultured Aquimarina sp. TaxID=575652 RepID=UPI002610CD4A|nr:hypothetical protein [uncultured Aquimarina sp.]
MINTKLINLGIILISIFLIIKMSFVILIPKGDTTVFLGLKLNPIKENIVYQYDKVEDGTYPVLYSDENQLIGDSFYRTIFAIPLIIYVITFILLFFLKFRLKRTR